MKKDDRVASLYFRGIAKIKYRYKKTGKDTHGNILFVLDEFYDIRISSVKKTSFQEYRNQERVMLPIQKAQTAQIEYNQKHYHIDIAGLKVVKIPRILHEQESNSFIHGEFIEAEVYFRVPLNTSSKNKTTGKKETIDGVTYEEIILKTGQIKMVPIHAQKGKPTGRVQNDNRFYRTEHYNSNGSTYWSKWSKKIEFPENFKPGKTGRYKTIKGEDHFQILKEDQTFEWVKSRQRIKRNYTATIVITIALVLFALIAYNLAFQDEGFVIFYVFLPIAIFMFVVVPLFNWILFITKKTQIILQQFYWMLTASLISVGLIYIINFNFDKILEGQCIKEYEAVDKDYGAFSQTETTIQLERKWNNQYDKNDTKKYHINIKMSRTNFCDCDSDDLIDKSSKPKEKYKTIFNRSRNKGLLKVRDKILDQIGKDLSPLQKIEILGSFISSRKYKDIGTTTNTIISPANVIFGIDGKGNVTGKADCDERTLAALFLMFDPTDSIEVAIFNTKTHSVLGISGIDAEELNYKSKHIKQHEGKDYFLWELTAERPENYPIGKIPNEPKYALNKWHYVIGEKELTNNEKLLNLKSTPSSKH